MSHLASIPFALALLLTPTTSSASSQTEATKAAPSKRSPTALQAQEPTETEDLPRLQAHVYHCRDGDTCRLKIAGGLWLNVRLAAIDAPELPKGRGKKKSAGQAYANEARDFLNQILKNKDIQLRQVDLDPFNRPVVEIYAPASPSTLSPQRGDILVNHLLVAEGYAEVYRGKTKRLDKTPYLAAESAAKKAKKGIWGLKTYQSPADFRKSLK